VNLLERVRFLSICVLLLLTCGCNKTEDSAAPATSKEAPRQTSPLARREVKSPKIDWEPPAESIPPNLSPESKAQYIWRMRTTVGAYKTVGKQNPKWDEPAIKLLTAFGAIVDGVKRSPTLYEEAHEYGQTALAAGCDDPLVQYYTAWFAADRTHKPSTKKDFMEAAAGLGASEYPTIRKFYGAVRAAHFVKHEAGRTNPPILWELRIDAVNYLQSALEEPDIPSNEALSACLQMFEPIQKSRKFAGQALERIEPVMTKRWPEQHLTWFIVGMMNVEFAWESRGGGWSSTVTEQGWKGFSEKLEVAEQALERSWKIKPMTETAIEMMRVELGQGQGRERMELWFDRAMELNPNSYEAANAKAFYLEPKWHGSKAELLAFGRQCVNSTEWGGKVPFVLWDAHIALERWAKNNDTTLNYWTQPGVWADVRASFEKFFKVNPKETSWRHNYALYAYKCQEYGAFLKQVELMGPVNYTFFSGKAAFEDMVATAKRNI
jgi:hypothetical protein